jgi:hypothetical protein
MSGAKECIATIEAPNDAPLAAGYSLFRERPRPPAGESPEAASLRRPVPGAGNGGEHAISDRFARARLAALFGSLTIDH